MNLTTKLYFLSIILLAISAIGLSVNLFTGIFVGGIGLFVYVICRVIARDDL